MQIDSGKCKLRWNLIKLCRFQTHPQIITTLNTFFKSLNNFRTSFGTHQKPPSNLKINSIWWMEAFVLILNMVSETRSLLILTFDNFFWFLTFKPSFWFILLVLKILIYCFCVVWLGNLLLLIYLFVTHNLYFMVKSNFINVSSSGNILSWFWK